MPRKKNWRIGKARKETLKQYFGTETDVDGISDWDLSNPLPSPVSDVRPSVFRNIHGVDTFTETEVDIAHDLGVDINLDLGNDTCTDTGVDTVMNLELIKGLILEMIHLLIQEMILL